MIKQSELINRINSQHKYLSKVLLEPTIEFRVQLGNSIQIMKLKEIIGIGNTDRIIIQFELD